MGHSKARKHSMEQSTWGSSPVILYKSELIEIVMPEFKNTAWVRSNDQLCGTNEDSVEITIPIKPEAAALTIHKTGPAEVCAFDPVNYQITVTNDANEPKKITVTDELLGPVTTADVSATY